MTKTIENTEEDHRLDADTSDEDFVNEYLRPVLVTVSDGNSFKTVIGD